MAAVQDLKLLIVIQSNPAYSDVCSIVDTVPECSELDKVSRPIRAKRERKRFGFKVFWGKPDFARTVSLSSQMIWSTLQLAVCYLQQGVTMLNTLERSML